MYVCVCNAVTDREIRQCVALGAQTFEQVRDCLGVSTCCGRCEPNATTAPALPPPPDAPPGDVSHSPPFFAARGGACYRRRRSATSRYP